MPISSKHIEAMDLNRLVSLWHFHYDKLRVPGKLPLPLVRVYFHAPAQE